MNKRLDYLDFLRVFFCITIFAYHINFLKGGYLAVCSFFVLSGYLSARAFKKEDFSILNYYKSRFLRVYLPMIIVVLCALGLCLVILPDVLWVSMKREVTSLLLGYNNFWQLDANLDYFARHVDSPYMHLWYVAILLQLEVIFPLIYGVMKFLGKKVGRFVPIVLAYLIAFCSMGYFIYVHQTDGLMSAYYNTFTRCFSWFFGLALGMLNNEKCSFVPNKLKDKAGSIIIFYILIVIQILLFVIAPADSKLYLGAMIATTLITCHLIDYARAISKSFKGAYGICIRYLSSISYEIFLIQYPVIYMFQYAKLDKVQTNLLIIVTVIVASILVNIVLRSLKKYTPVLILQFFLFFVLIGGTFYGGYRYFDAKDMQAELERLEKELAKQEEEQRIKQQEYEEKLKAEEEERRKKEEELKQQLEAAKADIDAQLAIIDEQELEMKEKIATLPVIFVGDSVLLGASPAVYDMFPSCYIDAQASRTAYVINDIFVDLNNRGMLGDPIVINCGANGDCPNDLKDVIMQTLTGKQVFWVTCTNYPAQNEALKEYAEGYDNLHIIDWATISAGHDEYFVADGIHLQTEGMTVYAQVIMDSIYDVYIEELEAQRAELEKQKQEISNQTN